MIVSYLSLVFWGIVRFWIRLCIIPLVDIICPVVDIRAKYFLICRTNLNLEKEPDLTIELWDAYVKYLQKSNKSNIDGCERIVLDYFDLLIKQCLARINRGIKMKITSQFDIDSKYIDFREFCEILEAELGSAPIYFKYRYTKNSKYFESIFGDDGFYRRFKWCDRI